MRVKESTANTTEKSILFFNSTMNQKIFPHVNGLCDGSINFKDVSDIFDTKSSDKN